MLKITINNEEVVSNKDFTIEEEMLNTSSVILNNVYPKSWENDKDYVSRFYHPNDYSKCLIKDEDYTPAEPGLNEEGTNFQVTADTTKLNELTSMKGNTSQSGTPTPTSPVPINVVSGRQDVVVAQENALDIQRIVKGRLDSGNIGYESNVTSLDLGEESFSFTTNANYRGVTTDFIHLRTSTFIYFGYESATTNIGATVSYYDENMKFISQSGGYGMTNAVRYGNSVANAKYIRIYFALNTAGSVTITKPQIRFSNENSIPTYEAYKGNTYEINLGKNLLSNYSTTQTKNGVSYTVNQDKSITLNGTSTGAFIVEIASGLTLEAGTYTLSLREKIQGCGIYAYTGSGVLKTYVSSNNTPDNWKTNFTLDSTTTFTQIRIDVQINKTFDNITIYPMIEKGSQATTYAPYKTPIELCKIGNYQDRIYKNGNKWYLEKNIGKVVLNGSESWKRTSVSDSNSYAFWNQYTNLNIPVGKYGQKYCDRFEYQEKTWSQSTPNHIAENNRWESDLSILFNVDNTIATTVAQWNTWLQTHNTSVYYVLATPTYTEITDTELISQLNSIELLEGLNNVSVVSPYLQGIINLHYNYTNEIINSSLLFCGVVKNSGNISLNPRYPHYQTLQILDFKTFLSEGETLDFVIANKTVEGAIDQIINTISPYGFIKGNIQIIGADTIIGAYSTKDKTAYDVFNYLADITQSRWTTRLIDENTVAIDFYDPTLLPQGKAIQYNQTWFRDNLIDDMSYSYGSNDYRNKQVMTSNEVIGNQEQAQLLYANGYQTQYMTDINIATIESISVNGVPKTYATNDQKELGAEADFYYTIGNNIVESAIVYSTNDKIDIRYLPIVEGRQVITNDDEIGRVSSATGRKGIVARYENRNDATTSNELQLIGQSYIKYKGVPEIKLVVQTRLNIWNIGDRVQFNAPITELTTEYMVKSKKTNYIATIDTIFYTFELTSSFNMEQDINYFDNQRAKAKGNIGEGEAISRNIDIEDTTNIIFYGATESRILITTDNSLEARLEAPFNR